MDLVILMKSLNYKVVICPSCNNVQVIKAKKIFKCKFCDFETEVEKLRIFFSTNNASEAGIVARNLKFKLKR
jgi:ribosomal protein L37AE/L43A